MVDTNSPAFTYSRKVGIVIEKGIRYVLVGFIVAFISGKIAGSKSPQPVPKL